MNICIVAGEPSGDRYAARLIEALRQQEPHLAAFGLGGEIMRKSGVELLTDMTRFAFMGFTDPLRHYPAIMRIMKQLMTRIERERPSAVILVDYPGFNLKVAKAVHALGIPVMYFMMPQVWAWGAHRLTLMRQTLRKAIVALPFEEAYFQKAGISAVWVGHPLVDMIPDHFRSQKSEVRSQKIVGIFPGSRESEVRAMWPVMRDGAIALRRQFPSLTAILAKMPGLDDQWYHDRPDWITVTEGRPYEVMATADVFVMASGTATLEAAFYGKPMVVMYKLPWLSYQIFRRLATVNHICLVNLVAGKTVVPELIQRQATPHAVVEAVKAFFEHPAQGEQMRGELASVVQRLGTRGVFDRASQVILECL